MSAEIIGFYSPSKGELLLEEVVDEISSFIQEEPRNYYRVVIGTDSQAKRSNGEHEVEFVTAIVVHRIGRGGRYFWSKKKENKRYVLRDRIYMETSMSLALASTLVPILRKSVPVSKYDFEIHIDVGPLGQTREMIKEVVGMVTGNGYTAKTKPESYGASTVADRHT